MDIALVGTRGVPARYGGFETCIEEVGSRLAAQGHRVTVYCRTPDRAERVASYRGMELVHLPAVPHKALETLSHTAVSVGHILTRRRPQAAIVFNAANAPFLPLLRAAKVPVATHVDGLEWKRSKWGRAGRAYYYRAESIAVRFSDALIADAQGIADHYSERFGAPTRLIRYGAPKVDRCGNWTSRLEALGLRPDGYHLIVARFEPENNIHVIVEGYSAATAKLPLVAVGSAPYGDDYIAAVRSAANDGVRFLGSVWDQELLDQLYANAYAYWHGHSVGGTNPSLLRALGAGTPTIAHDNRFNREVMGAAGRFFTDPASVAAAVSSSEADPAGNATFGARAREESARYDWDHVTGEYERLCADLISGRARRGGHASIIRQRHPSGGRAATTRVGPR